MSDYIQSTDFSSKDLLPRGHPNKIIKGSEFDSEFDAIATAIASKYDSSDIATVTQAQAESSNAVLMTPLRVANWADANAGIVGDLQALADPNADRLLFWDDSAGAAAFLSVGPNLSLSGTTLDVGDNVALKNAPSVFNATQAISTSSVAVLNLIGSGSDMRVSFQHLGAPENQGRYTWVVESNGTLSLRTAQDSGSLTGAEAALRVLRSAQEVTEVELNADALDFNGNADISGTLTVGGTISGNGSGLSSLNASNLSSGTVPDARLPATIGGNKTFSGNVVVGGTLTTSSGFSVTSSGNAQITNNSPTYAWQEADTGEGYRAIVSGRSWFLQSTTNGVDTIIQVDLDANSDISAITLSAATLQFNGAARIAGEGGVIYHDSTSNLGGKIVLSSSPAATAAQVGAPGDMRFVYS